MARNSIAPGGYIGGEPPRRPMLNQLSGVWKLDDAMERQRAGTWANPLGIEDLFSTYLYTGNGSTQTITNGIDLSGKSGCVWLKSRSPGGNTYTVFNDSGTLKDLYTNGTVAAGTATWTSWNNDGFALSGVVNTSSETYTSWTFREQAKFFDVVTYTGNGTSQSIAHNLGSEPGFVIIKATSTSGNWVCYHRSLGTGNAVFLNLTNASTAASDISAVSSTTFSVSGSQPRSNESGQTYVAYLFAHDAGGFGDSGNESVVKCGSYTGNGTVNNATTEQPGPDINLGWEPQWVMIKNTTSSDGWWIFDTMRGFNVNPNGPQLGLYANTSGAESTLGTSFVYLKLTNTGFKITAGTGAYFNESGNNYIYVAIRRGPMKAPTDATKVFKANTYTGNGSLLSITGAGFPPDFSFTTRRDTASWVVTDKPRGASLSLYTQATDAEVNNTTFEVRSYDQNGITYGQNSVVNGSSSPHVNYLFRRAPGFFDVVGYTGTGPNQQVAHSLGVVPEMMIIKSRNGAFGWAVYHSGMGTDLIELQSNIYGTSANPNWWDNGAPTSTLIKTPSGSNAASNRSGDRFVAYLFASCPGVSKVGSYTGTGTTLSVNCGFTNGARFVLIRRKDAGGDWYVWDAARGIVSGNDPSLLLNSTAAEVTNTDYIDPYSPGFEISSTAPAAINANGGSFIFLAIA